MTKVHHTIYKPRYEAYILDTVCTDFEGNELTTREAKVKQLLKQFESEQGFNVARVGKQKAQLLNGFKDYHSTSNITMMVLLIWQYALAL